MPLVNIIWESATPWLIQPAPSPLITTIVCVRTQPVTLHFSTPTCHKHSCTMVKTPQPCYFLVYPLVLGTPAPSGTLAISSEPVWTKNERICPTIRKARLHHRDSVFTNICRTMPKKLALACTAFLDALPTAISAISPAQAITGSSCRSRSWLSLQELSFHEHRIRKDGMGRVHEPR